MRTLLTTLLAAALLGACSEKPPRPDPEGVAAYNVENGPSPLAERTVNQGESERISH
jgi:hypothetical protein